MAHEHVSINESSSSMCLDYSGIDKENLHVDVKIVPVNIQLAVCLMHEALTKIVIGFAVGKTRNQVDPSNNQFRINETKHISQAILFKKLETVQSFCIPSSTIVWIHLKPPNEKEVHLHRLLEAWVLVFSMLDHDMENLDYSCIPVWVHVLVFLREDHDICTRERIDCVLITPEIISSVVYI